MQYCPASACVLICGVVSGDAFTETPSLQPPPFVRGSPTPRPAVGPAVIVTTIVPAEFNVNVRVLAPPGASTLDQFSVTLPEGALGVVGALEFNGYPVLRNGAMAGLITTGDLRRLEAEGRQNEMIEAVMTRKVVHAHPDQTLDTVVLKLAQRELSQLPVVSRSDDSRLLGIITLRDVARAQAKLASMQYSLGPDDTIRPANL